MDGMHAYQELATQLRDIGKKCQEALRNRPHRSDFVEDTVSTPKYGEMILNRLSDCRRDGLLCDLKIEVHGQIFQTHRILLAACSDYFRAMFSHDMLERQQTHLPLDAVPAKGMSLILDYVYTGHLQLTLDTLADVLATASFLQMTSAIDLCRKFMTDNMDFDNVEIFVRLGDLFGLLEMKDKHREYILANFGQFCKTEAFLQLDAAALTSFLAEDDLKVTTEGTLLKHVLRWYNHDLAAREPHAFQVFDKVRYVVDGWPTIDYASYQTPFQTHEQLKKLIEWCREYMHCATRRYLYNNHRTRVRSTRKTLVVIAGGIADGDIFEYEIGRSRYSNFYWHYQLKQWCPLGINANTEQLSGAPMIAINDHAVMFGGISYEQYYSTGQSRSIYCQEVKYLNAAGFAIWDLPHLLTERARHVAAHVPGYVFVVGGCNDSGPLASVERLNMDKEKWRFVKPLDKAVVYHSGVAYLHKVYICGGLQDNKVTNRVQCYLPSEDQWVDKAPLQTARYGHTMSLLGDEMIVCGGKANREESRCLSSVEAYNPETDQWTFLAPMRRDCAHMTATVLDEKLLILGGQNSVCDRLADIQEYDRSTNTWGSFGMLKFPASEVLCCAISVNLNLDNKKELYDLRAELRGLNEGIDQEIMWDEIEESEDMQDIFSCDYI